MKKKIQKQMIKAILKMSKQYETDFGTFDYEEFGKAILEWAKYFEKKLN